MLDVPAFDQDQGNWTEPLVFNISKYLGTEESSFLMRYVNYTKFRPNGASWAPIINEKCGNLTYEIVSRSYEESWQDNDLLYRPDGEGFFEEEGTRHLV